MRLNRKHRLFSALILAALVLTPAAGADELEPDVARQGDAYYHMMKALYVARQGQVGQAVREINEAVKLDPTSSDLKTEAASLLMLMGQQQQAERLVRQSLKADPDHVGSLEILAEILTARILGGRSADGALAEAITIYDRLILQPEADPESFRLLATFRLRAGDADGAIEAARRFVARQEGDAEALRLLANVLMHADRDEEAIEEVVRFLRETAGLDEGGVGFRDAVSLLDNLVRSRNAWLLFIDRAEPLLAVRPQVGSLRALYGEALLRVGRPEEAGKQMEMAIDLAGADPMLRYQLATVYHTLGRSAEAVELATGLAEEFPAHHGVQALLGEMLAVQARDLEAIAAYERALLLLTDDATEAARRDGLRQSMVFLWLSRGEPERARETLATLENPASIDALALAGRVALVIEDYDEALEFSQRLKRAAGNGAGVRLEAEIRAAQGDTTRARKQFNDAARYMGNTVWPIAADALYRGGDPDGGEEVLKDWRDEEPGNPVARYRLGQYLERLENFRQMEKELLEAIRLDPEFHAALNHLGYSMADRNIRLPEALGFIQRAVKLDPWNAAYLDSLGWAHFRMGSYEEARDPLERAVAAIPGDPVILEHLGDLYEKLGLAESALASYRSALKADPASQKELQAKIAALQGNGGSDTP
ncbi:MAG: tetratricopeptide repeat protein [Acidobacteria bacterium]|uniref:Tetratricopeptide repeat protein n=1 Tax=Candidatus Polarisedimenticola svalbardensis TaxID=2886004 RepID=A0A8J6XXD2_9BACT|nr:tetratricopeptide repeat protein [Candidatus Polarisedimenticola svalbardensis]